MSYMKPERFQSHMTLSEIAIKVNRDPSTILRLERNEQIPKAQRVRVGKLMVRLWSPKQAEVIQRVIDNLRPGRPRGS